MTDDNQQAPQHDTQSEPQPQAYPPVPPAGQTPDQQYGQYPPPGPPPSAYPPPAPPAGYAPDPQHAAYPPPQPGAYPPPVPPVGYPPYQQGGYPQQPYGAEQQPAYGAQQPDWGRVREEAKEAGKKSSPFKRPEPTPWMTPFLDSRGLPPGIGRFNWGAFFFTWIWAFVYGLPLWGLLGLAAGIGLNSIGNAVGEPVSSIIAVLQLGVALWFGFAINRAYWASNPKMLSVDDFNRKQIKWIVIGVAVFVLVFVLVFFAALFAGAGMLDSLPA